MFLIIVSDIKTTPKLKPVLAMAILLLAFTRSSAQMLEPRLLTNVPVHMNFLLTGYGFSTGRLVMDPTLPLDGEIVNGRVHSGFVGYVRSLKVFRESGKFSMVLPFASGDWDAVTDDGQDTTRSQSGMGDMSIRFSFNLTGSPALKAQEYAQFQQNVITGISFQLFLPTGAYEEDRLINIGSNRVRFRTVFGVSKKKGPWLFEAYGALWLFMPNYNYLEGSKLTQRPLAGLKVHLIRTLPRGNWITLDAGYAFGGSASVDGEARTLRISTFRFGITLAFPFKKGHNLRLSGYGTRSLEQGPDLEGLAAIYQYSWIDSE